MARGNGIIVTANPAGRFEEGFVNGTPLPGTVMQIEAAVEPVGGRYSYTAYDRDADGNRPAGAPCILLPKQDEARARDTAYADNERCFVYYPLPGEEFNMLWFATGTGTGDSVAIGDLAIVNDGDGLLLTTTGSPETEMFMSRETVSDVVAAGTLVHVEFTGY